MNLIILQIFYDLLLSLFIVLFFPLIFLRIRNEKNFYGDWKERIGIFKREYLEKFKRDRNLWIHTVSIGEFLSIFPIIENLKKENNLILSFTTKTGRKVAEEKIKDVHKIYFPFDISFIVRRVLKFLNPKLILIVETEIWPNLIINSHRKKIPLIIINARLSEKSYKNYKKLKFITKKVLPLVSFIITRSEEEKLKFIDIGAKEEKIEISGSVKFDMAYWMSKKIIPEKIREKFGVKENEKIIVFGSIHPEEEEGIVEIIKKIMGKFGDVKFFIVPRYLDRTEIYKKLKDKDLFYLRRTELGKNLEDGKIIVVDTYGELSALYSICDFAFVGGSLNGYGGQNPVEVSAFGKCVICGKDMFLLKEEWEVIKKYEGGIEVKNFEELYEEIVYLLENPEIAEKIGKNGYKAVIENKGAIEKTLKIINSYLK